MSSSDDTLGRIDDVLTDWHGSADAMHWQPDVDPEPKPGPQLWIVPAGTDPAAASWQEVGTIGDFEITIDPATINPVGQDVPTVTWDDLRNHIAAVQAARARRAQIILEALQQALRRLAAPVAEAAATLGHVPEAEDCADCRPPLPRRDRPAWQSPYGPARRRR
ncbi:hypothetical protein ACWERY_02250 [Streptomyces sp. NPDC004082]